MLVLAMLQVQDLSANLIQPVCATSQQADKEICGAVSKDEVSTEQCMGDGLCQLHCKFKD